MTNETPTPQDHQEPKPTTAIELGKWFYPFTGYDPDPAGKVSRFLFEIQGPKYSETGNMIKGAEFYEVELLPKTSKGPSYSESEIRESRPTIASPFGETMIPYSQLGTEEKKMETQLVRFSPYWHGFPPEVDIPYRTKMRLPDGTEITMGKSLRDAHGNLIKPFSYVYIPNTRYVLAKIQIMITPKG